MDCVKNCGYNNLSFSRVMTGVFSLKITPYSMWVMWVYIVWIETWCIRYDKLAKQNVSRVSHEKVLLARHSRKPTITICHNSLHSSHVLSTCFTLQEGYSQATCENSLIFNLPWVFTLSLHTTHTMKFHIKYRVQKIEHNYNQIWHRIKANKKIVVNHNFTCTSLQFVTNPLHGSQVRN